MAKNPSVSTVTDDPALHHTAACEPRAIISNVGHGSLLAIRFLF